MLPLLPIPILANKFPNKLYRPKDGAATNNGINLVLNMLIPISIALPILPTVGEESKVEQTL